MKVNKEKLREHAQITFEAFPEYTQVRGNLIFSGDDAQDRADEDRVIERLNQGDIAAWFVAEVTASLDGFTGIAYLGTCSYDSLDQFTSEKDDYYRDMVDEALEALAKDIDASARRFKTLKKLGVIS